MSSGPQTRRVVAVQLAVELGEVERNLRHVRDVVGQAVREHAPDMVFLPESANTPNVHHPAMRRTTEAVAGETLATLRRLARDHGCVVGGGFLAVRGGDAYGTYAVCEPDGAVHLHDKDQPSMWENHSSRGGDDPGIADTAHGPIGVANGFEWLRSRTAARVRGRVRLMAGGMCFPSFPKWAVTAPWFWRREHATMVELARETPPRMARVLGVPCVHPSHVGEVTMRTPFAPGVPWPTEMLGETQVCDASGQTLGRLSFADGEGWVCADVDWVEPSAARPENPVPEHFWMPVLPWTVHAVWYATNAAGRAGYALRKRRGDFPWQAWPPEVREADLPDCVPAGMLALDGEVPQPVA
ncbi:carbon-nitrogen hydrolase family protein [Conexibacter sp. SYSU D00693]|uniref:carbon-nitrogen hydrolase family protein n=1 Tax=Conexibacter sp. SYSU D00693 TaxID=2812560 RepID=UPI001F11AF59|nr:carbon-nitrogen hydrolase family protein [Conexibacter sp. SYSU D00693]